MKYFVPELKLGILLPLQVSYQDKYGGLPWGLPVEKWPTCRECGAEMSMVAQFMHDGERLDLGREGRTLFLFMCGGLDSGGCQTFLADGGANSCFVLEPEEMISGLSLPPSAAGRADLEYWSVDNCGYCEEQVGKNIVWFYTEARVIRWVMENDGLAEEDRSQFLTREGFWKNATDLPDVSMDTRLGGVPYWVQEPELEGWTFIGQIQDSFDFSNLMPEPDEVGCPVGKGRLNVDFRYEDPVARRWDGPRYICGINPPAAGLRDWMCESSTNFGTGTGYLFCRFNGSGVPECRFFWQCS